MTLGMQFKFYDVVTNPIWQINVILKINNCLNSL